MILYVDCMGDTIDICKNNVKLKRARFLSFINSWSTWWLDHPFQKYARQIGLYLQILRVKIPKMCFETTT